MTRIKQIRKECKISQREAARHLDIPATTYGSYENGKRDPPFSAIMKMCYLFGCSADYLLGRGPDIPGLIRPLTLLQPKEDFFDK